MKGFVSLVGAGPGNPELLTRAALHRLRRADLILYDALVPRSIMALARRARRFAVGKRAGGSGVRQETIHLLMIRAARRGLRVVRLKGGDPFVFGRGGEEALALRRAGVPFEVVPGISAAIAAPALAGIPVTHRGTASAFVVISAHDAAAYGPVLDAIRPGAMTLVFLMALRTHADVARALLDRGWPIATPTAILLAASRANAATWTGTLASLARGVELKEDARPGTLVVGDVVRLHHLLASTDSTIVDAKVAGSRAAEQGLGSGERRVFTAAGGVKSRMPCSPDGDSR